MKTSIEVELWVIDEDGELCEPGRLTEISDQVEEEFVDCLFEIKTTPCESVAELRREFIARLDEVLRTANALGKSLVPLGTPINSGAIKELPSERTRIQREVVGDDFEYVKRCAGTHIHFEKRDVVEQLNTLTALDPALALLSSSPYYDGHRIAAGARPYVYRKKGYARFPSHGNLWSYVDSVAAWDERLERRYAEFKEAALEAGVDERTFDEHFTSDDTIWTPIRLRKQYPTVEWRSPDAALPSQTLRLADEMYSVMERTDGDVRIEGDMGLVTDGSVTLPRFETVREYTDAAIQDGLDSAHVRSYLKRMGFDVLSYEPLTQRIDGPSYVSKNRARELRLEYAQVLERDIAGLARAQPTLETSD